MASKAGDISIEVIAEFARFRDDMGKLGASVKSSVTEMQARCTASMRVSS